MTARRIVSAVSLVVGLMVASSASAQISPAYQWTSDRPDAVAPTGVLGDHLLPVGEFFVSYTLVNQVMDGSLWGTDSIDIEDIFDFWTVAPVNMSTMTHGINVLYGLTETLTLEGNLGFTHKQMENWTETTTRDVYLFYETARWGIEDIKVSALWSIFEEGPYRAHVSAGMSLPVGEVDSYDVTPFSGSGEDYLGYPMQIGSGTFDFLPGFTFQVQNPLASFGMQGKGTIRIGQSSQDWSYGDRYMGTAWAAYRFSDYISASGRIEALTWGNVDGYDGRLSDPFFSPATDPDRMGGTRVDLPLGVNVYFPEGHMEGYRVSVEGVKPLYQDLDGPQLKHDWSVRFGIYKVF